MYATLFVQLWHLVAPLVLKKKIYPYHLSYSEPLNNEYIERIYKMSYSSLSDNGMLQIFSFLIKWLYGTL